MNKYTLQTKFHVVKAMAFPVVMYECETWTVKKAECWRIDAFKLWSWKRFLRVPWTARRSNQSILKEISPEYSLEELMLKLQFIGGSDGKASVYTEGDLGSIPGLGRSAGEGKGCPLQYSDLENSMGCTVHGVTKSQTWLNNFHFSHAPLTVIQSML